MQYNGSDTTQVSRLLGKALQPPSCSSGTLALGTQLPCCAETREAHGEIQVERNQSPGSDLTAPAGLSADSTNVPAM